MLDAYGNMFQDNVLSVEGLIRRYELLKNVPGNIIHCQNEESEWVYCMVIPFAYNDIALITEFEKVLPLNVVVFAVIE